VAHERVNDDALRRAAGRLGVSAAALSVAKAGLASAAAAQAIEAATAAAPAAPAIATAVVKGTLSVTLLKAIGIGLGAGSLMVGAAQLAQHSDPVAANGVTASVREQVSALPVRVAPVATTAGNLDAPSASPNGIARPNPAASSEAPIAAVSNRDGAAAATPSAANRRAAPLVTTAPEIAATDPKASNQAVARFQDDFEPSRPRAAVVTVPSAAASVQPEAVAPAPRQSSLATEIRVLDEVREALSAGNPELALSTLNQHQGLLQSLSQEAAVLRVEALGRAGRTTEAKQLAARLLQGRVTPAQRRTLERWANQ
jgi:hypothetical protein